MQKSAKKHTSSSKNDMILKSGKTGHFVIYSKAKRSKMAYLGLKIKVSKDSKNDYRTTFKLFYAKKGLKKPHIEKRQTFEFW